ncbi:redoxin domain-containing protein [Peribacillus saganii]|nr:redoxin domain-containing protein [Peribacillus saganii]
MSYINIGNLTIQAEWFSVLLAFVTSALLYKIIVRNKICDWYWNSFFVYFLIWKLTYILFNVNTFFSNPLSILFFNGGTKGHIIGICAVIIYISVIGKRGNRQFYNESFTLVSLFLLIYQTIMSYFGTQTAHLVIQSLFLMGFFISLQLQVRTNQLYSNQFFLLVLLLQILISSIFKQATSVESFTFISLAACLLILSYKGGLTEMKKNIVTIAVLVIAVAIILVNLSKPKITVRENDHSRLTNKETQITTSSVDQGVPAPDFELTLLDGETVKLSDYKGKTVILNFWATWCPPCKAEMPHMQNFYKKNINRDVTILAVNLTNQDKGEKVIENFVKDYRLTFPIPLDENGEVGQMYQAITIPTSYIINKDGVITKKVVGPMDEETMTKLVNDAQ